MKHAREDYDCIQPWPTKRPHIAKVDGVVHTDITFHTPNDFVKPLIPEDEPVFLIRGQDLAAVPAMEVWCETAEHLGASPEIVQRVRDHIDTVLTWQSDHASKVPDLP